MTHEQTSIGDYVGTFVALLVLLGLTVGVAYVETGPFAPLLAMTIAVIKTVLIMLYFMHLRHGLRLVQVFAVSGFFWLALLLLFVLCDYVTRTGVVPAAGR